ncbi:purple acid phosphatase 22-like [Mercurialis annua]|uniref:purple acid phosphatase 22-like n=1 Tax=Mercurialis annua TaxID=3986 RepID=UPI00215F40E0|nr:purple acid phosphatase 22-like [Mercurialis annua]
MDKFLPFGLSLLLTTSFFNLSLASTPSYSRPSARSLILTPHNRSNSDPQQVHISLAGKDYMRVTWITEDKHVESKVEYGKETGRYNAMKTGDHTSYNYFFYSSPKIHHVKIGPLEPNSTYFYRCGGYGPEFSFNTPPSNFPIEFVVVGDLGQTEWTKSTLEHVGSRDYDVFLLPGDLSYADSQQPLWDSFGRLVEPYASQRPWMVTEGNHEIETFPFIYPHGFKAYNSRWLMPYEESGSTSNLYYSFDVAGAHVIMLGSYTDFEAESDQYKWLEGDLGKIDRKKTPWVIVLLHAPWYNTNTAHQGEGESMRKAMEEMLYKARVDVIFSGHVHAYERFTRIYDNKADPCGPMHITIGDGGNREGLALLFKNPASVMSLFREPSFGHGRLKIVDETRAYWSWQRNDDSTSSKADDIWLHSLSSSKACWANTIDKKDGVTSFVKEEL